MFVDELETLTRLKFNLSHLKPFQRAIITDFIHGNDILVISPTGSGKSLCYQLPAMLLPGTFIIISPLIALMQDQVNRLRSKNIEAAFLHANLTPMQQQNIFNMLTNAEIKLLYLSPEKLLQNHFLSFLKQQCISGFAIDEVHCMLQWGQDFRPEYQGLARLKRIFPHVPIMALTATANPKQQDKIIAHLGLRAKKHISSIERPNIQYTIIKSTNSKGLLNEICTRHAQQSGIIYTASRQRVAYIANYLQQKGFKTLQYHAGMAPEEKQLQIKRYHESHHIMVATIAFGMGIDKADIRFIIHLDTPGGLDQLMQESGRCGRDGQKSFSYILLHPANFLRFNFWHLKKAPPLLFRELVDNMQAMAQFLTGNHCYYQFIQNYYEQTESIRCGTCERCQAPSQAFDLQEDELKILSCIVRLKNKANSSLLIEILQGIRNTRTQGLEHLSTFGIGQHLSPSDCLVKIIQLFAHQLIDIVPGELYWTLTTDAMIALKLKKHARTVNHRPDLPG